MPTKTVVWHQPTDQMIVLDHPSQIGDLVSKLIGKPPESSLEVIPKEFHVFPDVPYHTLQGV
jgi:hypothetical protein